MSELERRCLEGVEFRAEGDSNKIVGYAATFNTRSHDLGNFTEIIKPGAFTRSLKENTDVRAMVNHDPNLLLGRTTSGTLSLVEDQRGLRFEISPPDTQWGRDVVTLIKRGDISGCSFGFRTAKGGDSWRAEGGKAVRELKDVDVFDVTIATYPAYPNTGVALRSLNEWQETTPEGACHLLAVRLWLANQE